MKKYTTAPSAPSSPKATTLKAPLAAADGTKTDIGSPHAVAHKGIHLLTCLAGALLVAAAVALAGCASKYESQLTDKARTGNVSAMKTLTLHFVEEKKPEKAYQGGSTPRKKATPKGNARSENASLKALA
jgi:hypothetical protein